MSDTRAIFLSYASQDADAAHPICDSLRDADLDMRPNKFSRPLSLF